MLTNKATQVKETNQLRQQAGVWFKELRETSGLSQREMASQLNLDYYTFISQLENGRGRVPQNRYRDWAEVLGVDPKDFVRQLMSYYDPETYDILFGDIAS